MGLIQHAWLHYRARKISLQLVNLERQHSALLLRASLVYRWNSQPPSYYEYVRRRKATKRLKPPSKVG